MKVNGPSNPQSSSAAAGDLWRHTLAQIPSLFGRLVYLAGLRDSNTGEYVHHGLATVFGGEQAHLAMQSSHEELFSEWLASGIDEQKRDLDLYVSTLEPERKKLVENWTKLEPFRSLPPVSARSVERELFYSDLELLLSLQRNELGVSWPGPDA